MPPLHLRSRASGGGGELVTSEPRVVVAISDVEMGAGGVYDDYPNSGFLAQLLDAYCRPPFEGLQVDVVFNGDTFDLLKTPVDGTWPSRVNTTVAKRRMEKVASAHGDFFAGVRRFLEHPRHAVHFVVGNHDQELLFDSAQQVVRDATGHTDGVHFPGFSLRIGDVHLEHGSQEDSMFKVDEDQPFVRVDGEEVLALPWGTIALAEVAMPLHPHLYELDRIKPRSRVFALLPEVADLVTGAFWRYWRSGVRDWLDPTHPLKRLSWTMVKEIAWRFGTLDPDVAEGHGYRARLMREEPDTRLIIAGHLHRPSWWSWADRKLLYTGCFRDEFYADPDGTVRSLLPKTYAEAWLVDDRVVRSHLVEVDAPPPPDGHVPDSVFAVLPRVRPLLDTDSERAALRRDESAQLAREADD